MNTGKIPLRKKWISAYSQQVLRRSDANSLSSSSHMNSDRSSQVENQHRSSPRINTEVEKWKEFGMMMADSFEELKKQHDQLQKQTLEEKETIQNLEAQVEKLKRLLARTHKEREELKLTSRRELERVDFENSQLKARMELMPEESSKLADEVITLRTNLDKSVSKIQKLNKRSSSVGETPFLKQDSSDSTNSNDC